MTSDMNENADSWEKIKLVWLSKVRVSKCDVRQVCPLRLEWNWLKRQVACHLRLDDDSHTDFPFVVLHRRNNKFGESLDMKLMRETTNIHYLHIMMKV